MHAMKRETSKPTHEATFEIVTLLSRGVETVPDITIPKPVNEQNT